MAKNTQGKGILSKPPAKGKQKAAAPKLAPKRNPLLSGQQNRLINTQRSQDLALTGAQGRAIDQAVDNTQQPFDWSGFQMPTGPDFSGLSAQFNPQDWNQYRQEQIDLANQDFDARMGKDFAAQKDAFEQEMYNRGIPVGSDLYNKEKTRIEMSQADAKRSNLLGAMNQGAANASAFGNLALQTRSQGIADASNMYGQNFNAYNNQVQDAMARRYQPLNEANMFRGAQSPLMALDAQFGNQGALQQQQIAGQMQLKRTPGGGGGGAGEDPNNYRGSGMNFNDWLAATTGAQIAVNSAGNRGGSGPSPWWALAGSAIGSMF